jgi:acetyltransferase-like isoleucine patch superfamily enzyme
MNDFDSMMMPPPWKEYTPNNAHPKKWGENCTIHAYTWIGDKVTMGKNVKVQAFAFIPNGVTIGDNVFVGPHVCFTNDKYPPMGEWRDTFVQDGAVIGANATILPGVTLGYGCQIGAGAVVTKDVPPGETWVGNPAKPL